MNPMRGALYGNISGLLLTLFLAPALCAAPTISKPQLQTAAAPQQLQLPLPEKDWTITAFFSGKNNLSYDMFWALNNFELAGPSARVNMVAEVGQILRDRGWKTQSEWSGTRRFYLSKDSNPKKLSSLELPGQPYADLSSPLHLQKYLAWSKANFPAKKHMLLFKNHGHGIRGISNDDRSKKQMSVPGFASAVKKAGGVDVLFIDACLMQTLEVLYELRGAAPLVVASEEFNYSTGFDFRKIMAAMNRNPNMKPETAAKKVLDGFGIDSPTVSTMKTAAADGLAARLDEWTLAVMAAPDGKAAAAGAAKKVLRLGDNKEHADLMHFVYLVYLSTKDEELRKQSEDLVRFYKSEALAGDKTNDIKNAFGLSIYLPPDGKIAAEYGKLAFAKTTKWPQFLGWLKDNDAVYGEIKPEE